MRLVLVAVGVVCVLAAGCGGVENEPNLATAVERTEALGSALFEAQGVETEDGKRVEIDCTGAADYASRRIKVSCDYGEMGKLEVVAVGDDFYLRGLGATGLWLKDTSDTDDPSIHDFSPEKLLAMLRAASSETARVGEEGVRGFSTVTCTILADSPDAETKIDPLEAAFEELQRAIQP